MAWLLADSFDFYTSAGDFQVGPWDAYTGTTVASSRFGVGRSAQIQNTAYMNKLNWGSNESEVILAAAFVTATVFTGAQAAGVYFQFRDAGVSQVSVQVSQDGNLYVRTGSTTIVGTFPLGTAANVYMQLQIKVVIHNTAGSVHIRKNGNTVDDYVVTNINTRGGSANNYVNGIYINAVTNTYNVDDLLILSVAGAVPNTWVGDIRAVQLMPTANTAQKDFNAISFNFTISSNAASKTIAPNTAFLSPFIPPSWGRITSINVQTNAAITGHARMAIFAADNPVVGAGPGTFLGASDELTNPISGANTFTFSTPVQVNGGGTNYYLALMPDVSISMKSGGSNITYTQNFTYPNFANITTTPTSSVSGTSWWATITYERNNFTLVNELQQDADTTYVFSDVVGAVDLYDLADLSVTPNSIVGVVAKQYVKKSDAAARSAALRVKSGATAVDTPNLALSTSYFWQQVAHPVDPNTGAAWTFAGVNALQIGPKVAA